MAFGAVLYEMLTGRKAFEGTSQATLIAAIISSDPPLVSQVQPIAPPMLDLIVRTCLAKDPDARFQSARDVGLSLRWLADGVRAAGGSQTRTSTSRRRDRVIFGVAGLLGGVVLATWLVPILFRTARESLPMPVRAVIPTPTARSFTVFT